MFSVDVFAAKSGPIGRKMDPTPTTQGANRAPLLQHFGLGGLDHRYPLWRLKLRQFVGHLFPGIIAARQGRVTRLKS